MTKPKIAVIGAGPAGLSAAAHLLEEAGDQIDVEVITMGHHLGGKAKTWRDRDGTTIEHGFHAVFGFYTEMLDLARRAGVDPDEVLVSSNGTSHFVDHRTGALFRQQLSRSALVMLHRMANLPGTTEQERDDLVDAGARMAATIRRHGNVDAFDDVCFKAFFLEHGGPPGFLEHPAYRQIRELLFNEPFEISAATVLRGAEFLGRSYYDAIYKMGNAGFSEIFWDPIGAYIERLGGRITRYRKLTRLHHDGSSLTGIQLAEPDNDGYHQSGTNPWPVAVPIIERSAHHRTNLAAVICTLPQACFAELNPGDAMWRDPFFGNITRLRSVATMSLQIFQREPLSQPVHGTIFGLPLPLGYFVDYKRIYREHRASSEVGAALQWVGQEVGFENVPDQQIIDDALQALSRLPGHEGCARGTIIKQVLKRNRSNHQRYLLTEPGTLRLRPTVVTPLRRLFLAGDWIRNEIDIPTMEGAIRCGRVAAHEALASL